MTLTIAQHAAVQQQAGVAVAAPAGPVTPQPPAPTQTVLAIDGSNWTEYDYTPAVLSAWKAQGVGLIIEQAIDPPASYPVGRTRQHIQACLSFGMPVAIYVFWWAGAGTDYLKRQLATLDGFEDRLVRAWLDVEDVSIGHLGALPGQTLMQPLPTEHLRRIARQPLPARDGTHIATLVQSLTGLQDDIAAWLDVLDGLPVKNREAGIYSGPWYSPAYVDLSPFASRPHWSADYDGVADVNVGTPWGGYSLPWTIKQFRGSTSLAGRGGIDLNAVNVSEVALF